MIASGPRRRGPASGRISGSGLASARISGLSASSGSHSGFSTRGADRPRKTSAPASTSRQRRARRCRGRSAPCSAACRAGRARTTPLMSVSVTFSGAQPHRDQQIDAGQRRGAGAGGDQPHVGQRLALQQQPVADRGGDRDGGAVLVVVEHRNAHAGAQLRLDREAFRRLDVLQVDARRRWAPAPPPRRRSGRDRRRPPRCRTRRCRRIS